MDKIIIHEVGLRDGLQAEKVTVPIEEKINWIEGLFASGIPIIQLGTFVDPVKAPQLADTDALFKYFHNNKPEHVTLSGIVQDESSLERGLTSGVEMFCMGVSASEKHSQKKTGLSSREVQKRIILMAKTSLQEGKTVQGMVQSAFGCSYEGRIAKEKVINIIASYLEIGIRYISLADTVGYAYPKQVEDLCGEIQQMDPQVVLACHFHNTYGLGLANCYAALDSGVTFFETAVGGMGGDPSARVPVGNVCTEDLVHSFQLIGLCQKIKLESLIDVAHQVSNFFDRPLPSFVLKSGPIVNFLGR